MYTARFKDVAEAMEQASPFKAPFGAEGKVGAQRGSQVFDDGPTNTAGDCGRKDEGARMRR